MIYLKMSLPVEGGWTRWPLKIPFSLNYLMVLWLFLDIKAVNTTLDIRLVSLWSKKHCVLCWKKFSLCNFKFATDSWKFVKGSCLNSLWPFTSRTPYSFEETDHGHIRTWFSTTIIYPSILLIWPSFLSSPVLQRVVYKHSYTKVIGKWRKN